MNSKKKLTVFGIIVIICGILLLLGIKFINNKPQEKAEKEPANVILDNRSLENEEDNDPMAEVAKALENRNVFFSGINDASANKETVIELENPEANKDILISYKVINNDTGEELFNTDYIEAGKHVDWKPSDSLEPGAYELCFRQSPVWQTSNGEYIPLTSADNVVVITLAQ